MFSDVARHSVQTFRHARAVRRAENQTSDRNHPLARRILSAIQRANHGKFTAHEKAAFAAIESRRQSLLADRTPINTLDFGAGETQSLLTKEQQEAGFEFRYVVSQIASASKPESWARMLYEIVNEIRPSHVVEMGTCVGISGSYMAESLKLNGGRLTTIEGSKTVANLAAETFQALGYNNVDLVQGRFTETLLPVVSSTKTNIVFVDGHHDGEATVQYFNQMLPHLTSDTVIIFDDISWSRSMKIGWRFVSENVRVAAHIDLSSMGVAILN